MNDNLAQLANLILLVDQRIRGVVGRMMANRTGAVSERAGTALKATEAVRIIVYSLMIR